MGEDVKQMSLDAFAKALGEKTPVPGGGSVSAYVAALSAALAEMVANLTDGKKKYAAYQSEIEDILKEAGIYRNRLIDGIERDIEVFLPLSEAYGLPKETDEEKRKKKEILEERLFCAAKAPLELMGDIIETEKILDRLAYIGSKLAVSDVGVGILLADAALGSAALNVFINTAMMEDKSRASDINAKADGLIKESAGFKNKILSSVLKDIRG